MDRRDVDDEMFFEDLARSVPTEPRAPARLKSRVYSALMRRAAEQGPVRSLTATKEAGSTLCVFEEFCQILPLGARATVTLRHPAIEKLAVGQYRVELIDVSGATWSAPLTVAAGPKAPAEGAAHR